MKSPNENKSIFPSPFGTAAFNVNVTSIFFLAEYDEGFSIHFISIENRTKVYFTGTVDMGQGPLAVVA